MALEIRLDLLAIVAHDALGAADRLPSRAQLLRHVVEFVFLIADAAAITLAAFPWIMPALRLLPKPLKPADCARFHADPRLTL